jgi:WD40 repeat protein
MSHKEKKFTSTQEEATHELMALVRSELMAVGSTDGKVRVVNPVTCVTRWEKQGVRHTHYFQHNGTCRVAMSPDSRFVVIVFERADNWTLYEASTGDPITSGAIHDGNGQCICRTVKDRFIPVVTCPTQVHRERAGVYSVAFSPSGETLATGSGNGSVIISVALTGETVHLLRGHTERTTTVTFSSDGERLASGSDDYSIRIWDTATGGCLKRLENAQRSAGSWMQFSPVPNSRLLLRGEITTGLKLWDTDTEELKWVTPYGSTHGAFSPDGHTIATRDTWLRPGNEVLLLLDSMTGATLHTLRHGMSETDSAVFSPDSSEVMATHLNNMSTRWNSQTGALIHAIFKMPRGIRSMAWGGDWEQDQKNIAFTKQKNVAFAMGHHPRLGAGSRVQGLDEGLVRMILDTGHCPR